MDASSKTVSIHDSWLAWILNGKAPGQLGHSRRGCGCLGNCFEEQAFGNDKQLAEKFTYNRGIS